MSFIEMISIGNWNLEERILPWENNLACSLVDNGLMESSREEEEMGKHDNDDDDDDDDNEDDNEEEEEEEEEIDEIDDDEMEKIIQSAGEFQAVLLKLRTLAKVLFFIVAYKISRMPFHLMFCML